VQRHSLWLADRAVRVSRPVLLELPNRHLQVLLLLLFSNTRGRIRDFVLRKHSVHTVCAPEERADRGNRLLRGSLRGKPLHDLVLLESVMHLICFGLKN